MINPVDLELDTEILTSNFNFYYPVFNSNKLSDMYVVLTVPRWLFYSFNDVPLPIRMLFKWVPIVFVAIGTVYAAAIEERDAQVGCTCAKGTPQGQYCGLCPEVLTAGTGGSFLGIFECNPQGGCHYYGSRTECKTGCHKWT